LYQWKVDWYREEGGMGVLEALVATLKDDNCIKTPGMVKRAERTRSILIAVDVALKDWEAKEKDFDPDGPWNGSTNCLDQAIGFRERFGYTWDAARAIAMAEMSQCHKSFDRTEPGAMKMFNSFDRSARDASGAGRRPAIGDTSKGRP